MFHLFGGLGLGWFGVWVEFFLFFLDFEGVGVWLGVRVVLAILLFVLVGSHLPGESGDLMVQRSGMVCSMMLLMLLLSFFLFLLFLDRFFP